MTRAGAWRLALLGIAAVVVWRLADVLLLLFLAALLADLVRWASDELAARLHLSPGLALAVVAILLTMAVLAAAYWIAPAVAGQASDLLQRLATYLDDLRARFGQSPVARGLIGGLSGGQGLATDVAGYALTIARSTLTAAGAIFVVVVMSLYLAIAPECYLNGAVALVPPRHRRLARSVLEEIGRDLRLWVLGQLVDMITVGTLAAIGLSLLGVPVPFALATLAGLLTIVPYFGALAAGVPGVLVALTQGWIMAVWVVVIFTICHVVEGYVVAPIVQRHMVHLPPALTIGAISLSALLFGPLGIILGTPLAIAGFVIVRRVYVEHILEGGDLTLKPGRSARSEAGSGAE